MVENFEDKPAKLEFSRIFMEKDYWKYIKSICINSMIAVKFKVQDSRFKVQDSKLYFGSKVVC
jgi:hypothetical protein